MHYLQSLNVYFHYCHYHMVSCLCVLCHFKQEKTSQLFPPLEDLAILAYTTVTTSKHQRFMWPELFRNLIVFLHIVMWHISVNSLAQGYMIRVWLKSCDVQKNAFLRRILKFSPIRMWQPTNEEVTCTSCMLSWPDIKAFRDLSMTCSIQLYDPCIKYAQCCALTT